MLLIKNSTKIHWIIGIIISFPKCNFCTLNFLIHGKTSRLKDATEQSESNPGRSLGENHQNDNTICTALQA